MHLGCGLGSRKPNSRMFPVILVVDPCLAEMFGKRHFTGLVWVIKD